MASCHGVCVAKQVAPVARRDFHIVDDLWLPAAAARCWAAAIMRCSFKKQAAAVKVYMYIVTSESGRSLPSSCCQTFTA
jgi:hypothetical protein